MKAIKTLSQISSKNQLITLVIGSGVNQQVMGDKKTILSNWSKMLDIIFGVEKSKKYISNYILDFDRRLVKKTSKQDVKTAQIVQNELLENLCNNIGKEQIKKQYSTNYPLYLFNKDVVANVVSLNFDLIPERLLTMGKVPRLSKGSQALSGYKNSNLQRYREINGIRFWHPHGDLNCKNSLILGMRQYINNLKYIEIMRKMHKSNEFEQGNAPSRTWYESLVKHSVIILGSSMSDNELDIWGALINRERNFAKNSNQKEFRPPVYIMWSECNGEKFNKPDWIKPLFPVNFCYEVQWQKLKKIFLEKN